MRAMTALTRRVLLGRADEIDDLIGVDNTVSDQAIKTSFVIDIVLGIVLLIIFCFLQRGSILYRLRLFSPSTTCPPRSLPTKGFASLTAWILTSLQTSDLDLLKSAGLDALIIVKVSQLGMQLFLPIMIVGVAVLCPLHYWDICFTPDFFTSCGFKTHQGLMRYSITNLQSGSRIFWLHFGLIYIYMGYLMWLLQSHYHHYLCLRQHYLRKGDDVNLWHEVYKNKASNDRLSKGRVMIENFLGIVDLIKEEEGTIHYSGPPCSIPPAADVEGGSARSARLVEDDALHPSTLQTPISAKDQGAAGGCSPDSRPHMRGLSRGGSLELRRGKPLRSDTVGLYLHADSGASNKTKVALQKPRSINRAAATTLEAVVVGGGGGGDGGNDDGEQYGGMYAEVAALPWAGGEQYHGLYPEEAAERQHEMEDRRARLKDLERLIDGEMQDQQWQLGKVLQGLGLGHRHADGVIRGSSTSGSILDKVGIFSLWRNDRLAKKYDKRLVEVVVEPSTQEGGSTSVKEVGASGQFESSASVEEAGTLINGGYQELVEEVGTSGKGRVNSSSSVAAASDQPLATTARPQSSCRSNLAADHQRLKTPPAPPQSPPFCSQRAHSYSTDHSSLPPAANTQVTAILEHPMRSSVSMPGARESRLSCLMPPTRQQLKRASEDDEDVESVAKWWGSIRMDPFQVSCDLLTHSPSRGGPSAADNAAAMRNASAGNPARLSCHATTLAEDGVYEMSPFARTPPMLAGAELSGSIVPDDVERPTSVTKLDLLAKPSVRYRKTINTIDGSGHLTAVFAQQYTVLVTDVRQPLYGSYSNDHASADGVSTLKPTSAWLGCGSSLDPPSNYSRQTATTHTRCQGDVEMASAWKERVKIQPHAAGIEDAAAEDVELLLLLPNNPAPELQRHGVVNGTSSYRSQVNAGGAADESSGGNQSGAASDNSMSKLEGSRLSKWSVVREAVFSGRVQDLLLSKRYSVVTSTFKRLFPHDFDRAIPVIRHHRVDRLLDKLEDHMGNYERARQSFRETGRRPLSCCGLFGGRSDTIAWHRSQIKALQQDIAAARRRALLHEGTPSWFVFFRTQSAATIASSVSIHAEDNREFKVHAAPGPEEVNWPTLWLNYRQRDWRRNLVRPLILIVLLFPVGIFTSGMQQLDYVFCPVHRCVDKVTGDIVTPSNGPLDYEVSGGSMLSCPTNSTGSASFTWEWYCVDESWAAEFLRFFVVGWLPALLLSLYQSLVMPFFLYMLTQASAQCWSLSQMDLHIASYMYQFSVFTVFIGGVLGTAIAQQISVSIKQGPAEMLVFFGTFLPASSNFFLNYLLLRTLVSIPLKLVLPHPGVTMYLLRRNCHCSSIITVRDRAIMYAPVSPRYGLEVGRLMLIYIIGLAFALVSPVLMPLVVLFFFMHTLFWRYSLLYVYVRKYESGGLMWPFVFERVMYSFLICTLFTACVFVAKEAYAQAVILLLTVPFILYRFSRFCFFRYQKGLKAMPLEYAAAAPPATVDPWVYIPPPLREKAFGWHPEWSVPWEGWGLPRFNGIAP